MASSAESSTLRTEEHGIDAAGAKTTKRRESPRLVEGRGVFVSDIKLPGMAYLAILRSPYGHARIKHIDVRSAAALPGVAGVFTGRDLVAGGVGALPCAWSLPGMHVPAHYPLALDKVRYQGDGVAAVVADTLAIAYDALDLIDVEYEPLPAVVDARAAVEDDAPLVHEDVPDNTAYSWSIGNQAACERALSEANHVVTLEIVNQRLIPNVLEPRAVAARADAATGEITIWTSSENPWLVRNLLSTATLNIPASKIRVIAPDMGRGFGSKHCHYPEEVLTPWVARALDRPVLWVSSRSESMRTDAHGRDHVTVCKLGLTHDGMIVALHIQTWANQGAYLSTFAPVASTVEYLGLIAGMYQMPAIWGEVRGTLTNTTPVDAYRGAGQAEANYLRERLIHIAAWDLGLDPVQIRRQNFISANNHFQRLIDEATRIVRYDEARQFQARARSEGRLVGIGVASCVGASDITSSLIPTTAGAAASFWVRANIRIHLTGQVVVMIDPPLRDPAVRSSFAQLVAGELGMRREDVIVMDERASAALPGYGLYGGDQGAEGGAALSKSVAKIKGKIRKIAAHLLEANPDDIVLEDGLAYVKGSPDQGKTLVEIALQAALGYSLPDGMEPFLDETTYYRLAPVFISGAHICTVEVDPDSGHVDIRSYVAVDDAADLSDPLASDTRIAGGVAQGIGQALYEWGAYDEHATLLSDTLMDYVVPTATMIPPIEVSRVVASDLANVGSAHSLVDIDAAAAAATVANAVMDALAPLGIPHLDMPLTPARIWQAIQARCNSQPATIEELVERFASWPETYLHAARGYLEMLLDQDEDETIRQLVARLQSEQNPARREGYRRLLSATCSPAAMYALIRGARETWILESEPCAPDMSLLETLIATGYDHAIRYRAARDLLDLVRSSPWVPVSAIERLSAFLGVSESFSNPAVDVLARTAATDAGQRLLARSLMNPDSAYYAEQILDQIDPLGVWTRTVYPRIELPKYCRLGETVELRVQLTLPARATHVTPVNITFRETETRAPVNISVTSPFFRIENGWATIELERTGDSTLAAFNLTAQRPGRAYVVVEFFKEGLRVGLVVVRAFVAEHDQALDVDEETYRWLTQQIVSLENPTDHLNDPPYGVTFVARVRTKNNPGDYVEWYNPALTELKATTSGVPVDWEHAETYFEDFRADYGETIERAHIIEETLPDDANARRNHPDYQEYVDYLEQMTVDIRAVGRQLYDLVSPEIVESVRGQPIGTPIHFATDDKLANMPWELVYDERRDAFWGELYPIGRLATPLDDPLGPRPEGQTDLESQRRVFCVAGDGLVKKKQLSMLIKELSKPFNVLPGIDGNVREPFSMLKMIQVRSAAMDHDVIHVTCLAELDERQSYYLRLGDDIAHRIKARHIKDFPFKPQTFFFANACSSISGSLQLNEYTNIAWTAYKRGVRAFIGAVAPVPTGAALKFAEVLYNYLIVQKLPIGIALWRTKKDFAVKAEKDPFYLLYCLYGDTRWQW